MVTYRSIDKKLYDNKIVRKSTSTGRYIPISEENLIDVLQGRPFNPKKKKQTKMMFRF